MCAAEVRQNASVPSHASTGTQPNRPGQVLVQESRLIIIPKRAQHSIRCSPRPNPSNQKAGGPAGVKCELCVDHMPNAEIGNGKTRRGGGSDFAVKCVKASHLKFCPSLYGGCILGAARIQNSADVATPNPPEEHCRGSDGWVT